MVKLILHIFWLACRLHQILNIAKSPDILIMLPLAMAFFWYYSLHLAFYKQPVYKQLALLWQIAKQLVGFNSLSIKNNKNYRLMKSVFRL